MRFNTAITVTYGIHGQVFGGISPADLYPTKVERRAKSSMEHAFLLIKMGDLICEDSRHWEVEGEQEAIHLLPSGAVASLKVNSRSIGSPFHTSFASSSNALEPSRVRC
jgi:hypothetical protein